MTRARQIGVRGFHHDHQPLTVGALVPKPHHRDSSQDVEHSEEVAWTMSSRSTILWRDTITLDASRNVVAGDVQALRLALGRGADLRIYSEFRHNEHMAVLRETEKVLIPERGVMLGNFGVAVINRHESWVTDSEFITNGKSHQRGADGSTFIARLKWSQPNRGDE